MGRIHQLLARFQAHLESIHAIRVEGRVQDFLLSQELFAQVRGPSPVPEELLLHEDEEGLSIGLYIAPEVLEALSQKQPPLRMLLGELLPHYCVATEGVSHWLYVNHRAERGPVSQLELEVQAEVDKFASCVLGLWQLDLLRLVRRLRERLYDGVRYFAHLGEAERERYATANRLARSYAASLERRFIARRDLDGLLRELRQSFRLSGGEKYAHLATA